VTPLAHIGGLPVEEGLLQLAPATMVVIVGLRLACAEVRSWVARRRSSARWSR
jgi:hypothetical protein